MTEFETLALAELRRIRELLEFAGQPGLLRAIHSATRGAAFTTAELVRHAALPANGDLQAALEREFDVPHPRRIGKFLASIAGRPVAGFIAEAIGKERDGVIWAVRVSDGKHALPLAERRTSEHADASIRSIGVNEKCA